MLMRSIRTIRTLTRLESILFVILCRLQTPFRHPWCWRWPREKILRSYWVAFYHFGSPLGLLHTINFFKVFLTAGTNATSYMVYNTNNLLRCTSYLFRLLLYYLLHYKHITLLTINILSSLKASFSAWHLGS